MTDRAVADLVDPRPATFESTGPSAVAALTDDPTWWRSAVIYEIYVRSFADGNGDGTGDLAGVRSRLPYLRDLGIDAIWFTPWYVSPLADGGYDVADYRAIDPAFGTLGEAEALIAEALELGIRTIIDIVPNHVSDRHPWFQAALAAGTGLPRARPVLVPTGTRRRRRRAADRLAIRVPGHALEPDDEPRRQARASGTCTCSPPEQPDLNWDHPDVRAEHEAILRFWFDRGAAGVRIDSAALLVKDPSMPEVPDRPGARRATRRRTATSSTTSTAPGGPSPTPTPGTADARRRAVAGGHRAVREVPAARRAPHRVQLRLHGAAVAGRGPARVDRRDPRRPRAGRGARDLGPLEPRRHPPGHALRPRGHLVRVRPQALRGRRRDPQLGDRRARAAALLTAALPGSLYIYQGDELGLDEVEVPLDEIQDPMHDRSGGVDPGRDGCRVPLPWSGDDRAVRVQSRRSDRVSRG